TCGKAVVAFGIGGLPDIVSHEVTGFLAPPLDTAALAVGIERAITDARGEGDWARAARRRAESTWSAQRIVPEYLRIYEHVLA
ncbi:MAG: glycosyltransferase, partial [Candidatus Nanopelagicales bacterium]